MSLMLDETLSIPSVLQAMLDKDGAVKALAKRLSENPPNLLITVARGSSDHAAAYLAHAMMSEVGIPTLSIPLSLASLHNAPLRLANSWVVALSQSGKSPDLIASVAALKQCGAQSVAWVNTADSPLAHTCNAEILLPAGLERSVAATKSYVAMLMVAAQTVAQLARNLGMDTGLRDALNHIPEELAQMPGQDWSEAVALLTDADRMMVIGRGAALPIALEAALKLKETCGIQAEAFSSAEVRHGPMEIIEPGYPVLVFAPSGPEQKSTLAFATDMRERGAKVLVIAPQGTSGADLYSIANARPLLEPFAMIQGFYLMANALAAARGRNPDSPRYLQKVTQTQ